MSGKITVIDRQQNKKRSRHYDSLWTQTTVSGHLATRKFRHQPTRHQETTSPPTNSPQSEVPSPPNIKKKMN